MVLGDIQADDFVIVDPHGSFMTLTEGGAGGASIYVSDGHDGKVVALTLEDNKRMCEELVSLISHVDSDWLTRLLALHAA